MFSGILHMYIFSHIYYIFIFDFPAKHTEKEKYNIKQDFYCAIICIPVQFQ